MRRFSLFSFVIVLPLLVAVACAIYTARAASIRARATTVFHKSIDNEINTKYSTGVAQLVAAYGPQEAAKIVEAKANTSTTIAFDGVSRFAKIVQQTRHKIERDPSQSGYSDGVVLEDFGHSIAAVWDGPIGTRISSIRFVDGNLIVSVYGNLQLGASTRAIPQEQPEDYVVPWPKGSRPVAGSLHDSVVQRHQVGG